jgi:hypothetical protein
MDMSMDEATQGRPEVFWAEIAPCEHLVQFYSADSEFLDSLEGFVVGGFTAGEAVVLIVTPEHLAGIEQRLLGRGLDLESARASGAYTALDADQTLSRFIFEGWPNDEAFKHVVGEVLQRARGNGRAVRAFGEMVAVLWAQGYCGATVRLEYLWQNLCRKEHFSLFCAYPKSGFTGDPNVSLQNICAAHTRIVA